MSPLRTAVILDLDLLYSVYCDTITAGGGWLVIQRRRDGSVDFNRDWTEYEDGFGFGTLPVDDKATTGKFWIGLYSLHCLTNQGQWELRIDYTFTNGTKGFDGATTDPITGSHSLNGMKFTTRDRDNDQWSDNCATDWVVNAGGWWYSQCSHILPNNQYNHKHTMYLNGQWHPLPFIEIKIRAKDCII
ncbi:fibrinogen-like protein 1 [Dysidea avara]|uniref:fibrinogen-like protein 1 n=1 Tax=Dysidea avara TaxID=196820 RepID=UPI00332A98B5